MNTHTSLLRLSVTRVLAAGLVAVSIAGGAALARAQGAAVGDFEASADVGAPRLPGSATYNAVSQEYRLSAAGVNMWGPRDEFHFAWKRLKGDFILQARVRFLGEGVDPHRKAGVIARTSLDADSPYADAAVHGDGLISLQFRRTKGATTEEARPEVKGADVVQLERKGSTLTLSAARFGELFTTSQVEGLALGDDVYVGLFLCSHNPDVVESAVFRDVRLVRPAREGFVPYRDYLGSRLEILDVQTGNRQVVHSSAEPFEAPNWTRDGRALIYNTSGRSEGRGRLHRFDLATRQSSPIDTGTAVRNNNDHVLSFDGAWLGISDQTAGDGQSPRLHPSRHRRDAQADHAPRALVLSRLVSGRPVPRLHRRAERRVRHLPDRRGRAGRGDEPHPPPGARRRAGVHAGRAVRLLQLDPQRHDADLADEARRRGPGAGDERRAQQLVPARLARREVDRVHHVPEGGPPADHPYYQRVTLRLMPIEGGTPRVIAYLYGGQGTINVPSWSPDGTMLAFVSNTAME